MHFVRGTDVNIRVARLSVHFSSLWLRFSSAIFPAAASHLGSEGTEQPRVPACWTVTLPLPHSNLLTTMFPGFLCSLPMPGPKEEKNHSDKTQTGALESFQNSTAVTIITLSSSLMFKCFLEWASLKVKEQNRHYNMNQHLALWIQMKRLLQGRFELASQAMSKLACYRFIFMPIITWQVCVELLCIFGFSISPK